MKNITIAIDGYSSCGKSTLAKALAKKINYTFIDSGAMYRGITLFALRKNMIFNGKINEIELIKLLTDIRLNFRYNALTDMRELYLNDENISAEIRSMEVATSVSKVAAIKAVREKLVNEQQEMGENGGVVMDGRDIGSVVFPKAELKLFVIASVEIRAQRRFDELIAKGEAVTLNEIKANLEQRDLIDTTRKIGPLIQTEDAILLDNSNLNQEQQLDVVMGLLTSKFDFFS